jgi:hypothetical protein
VKPEAQLVTLLTWMGWNIRWSAANGSYVGEPPAWWENPLRNLSKEWRMPPLTLDLMHKAEEKLTPDQGGEFEQILEDICQKALIDDSHWLRFKVAHATKEQRLEAVLKTIDRWDSENHETTHDSIRS